MAALLSDQIDRLNQRTRAIKSIASQTAHNDAATRTSRPFTHAVLNAEIGQLIRDIDATELGLFALVRRTYDGDTQDTQLKRIDFVGATPLKRNATRREEKAPDLTPEEYAQAALRCLQGYHKIRPMPRASRQLSDIMTQLQDKRRRIADLEAALKALERDQNQIDPPPAPKSGLKVEEESIQNLHSRLAELNERKKRLQSRKVVKPKQTTTEPVPPSSPFEDNFWGTPGEASRTLKFSANLLVDEQADFNDVNDASFTMPSPEKDITSAIPTSLNFTHSDPSPEPIYNPASPVRVEETVAPNNVAPPTPLREPEEEPVLPTPKSVKSDLFRVNAGVERITSKISTVYGELLALAQEGRKPSSAKDVIACLRNISTQTPSLDSPSHSSVSNANSQTPSAQEVLTSYLLIQLLSAPGHTIPLNKLKDSLSTKSKSGGMTVGALGQNPTRILYGCVGKRLVKIERSGGEQLVKFNC